MTNKDYATSFARLYHAVTTAHTTLDLVHCEHAFCGADGEQEIREAVDTARDAIGKIIIAIMHNYPDMRELVI